MPADDLRGSEADYEGDVSFSDALASSPPASATNALVAKESLQLPPPPFLTTRPAVNQKSIDDAIAEIFSQGRNLRAMCDHQLITTNARVSDKLAMQGLPYKMQAVAAAHGPLSLLQHQQLRLVNWALNAAGKNVLNAADSGTEKHTLNEAEDKRVELAEKLVHWSMGAAGGTIDHLKPADAYHLFMEGLLARDVRINNALSAMTESAITGALVTKYVPGESTDIHGEHRIKGMTLARQNLSNTYSNMLRELGVSTDKRRAIIYHNDFDYDDDVKYKNDMDGISLKGHSVREQLQRDFIVAQLASALADVYVEMNPHIRMEEKDGSKQHLEQQGEGADTYITLRSKLNYDEHTRLEAKLGRLREWVEFAGEKSLKPDQKLCNNIGQRVANMLEVTPDQKIFHALLVQPGSKDIKHHVEWSKTLKAIDKLIHSEDRIVAQQLVAQQEPEVKLGADAMVIGHIRHALAPLRYVSKSTQAKAFKDALEDEFKNQFQDVTVEKLEPLTEVDSVRKYAGKLKNGIGKFINGVKDELKETAERAKGSGLGEYDAGMDGPIEKGAFVQDVLTARELDDKGQLTAGAEGAIRL